MVLFNPEMNFVFWPDAKDFRLITSMHHISLPTYVGKEGCFL